jgi:hypothetical protein
MRKFLSYTLALSLCAIFGVLAPGAVVLDRIAVIVGKHAIKASDVERDLRVTEFLNRAPLDLSAKARHQSADRLVDQSIIRDEIASGDYDRATDGDVETMLTQLRLDRDAGSDARLRQDLSKYGLTEDDLKDAMLWQLTVLKFIDERFKPAVLVQEQNVKAYYEGHLAELKKQYPQDNSFTTLAPKIEDLLQGQQVDQQFDAWLDEQRKGQRVDYRQEAFQ